MIYKVVDKKYKVGCNRGLAKLDIPGILDKVNSISEWSKLSYPSKEVETVDIEVSGDTIPVKIYKEDKKFLKEGKLAPGSTILIDGQIISFDSVNRMVLVVSETGRLNVLERIYEECIKPEYELAYEVDTPDSLVWRDLEVWPEEFDTKRSVPFPYYKIWKDRFVEGRNLNTTDNGLAVHVTVQDSDGLLPFPVELIFSDWEVYYRSEDFDEGEDDCIIDSYVQQVLAGFYERYSRIGSYQKELTREEQIILAKQHYEEIKNKERD